MDQTILTQTLVPARGCTKARDDIACITQHRHACTDTRSARAEHGSKGTRSVRSLLQLGKDLLGLRGNVTVGICGHMSSSGETGFVSLQPNQVLYIQDGAINCSRLSSTVLPS